MPKGMRAVSPWTISTSASSQPSISATTSAKVVSCPWPWLWLPVKTETLPVGLTRTVAAS